MIPVRVEKLTSNHISELVALEGKCFESAWSAGQYEAGFDSGAIHVFGIRDNSQLFGYVAISLVVDEMEILNIAVLPSHQRQGHGFSLLSAALAFGESNGVVQVFLDVAESNLPALRLYQKSGFVGISLRKKYYANDDAVIMRLSIGGNGNPEDK